MDVREKLERLTINKIVVILSSVFLLLRLINIRILPIFNDEATYIDWGWRMLNMEGQAFHSVVHAKTPLLMWIFGLAQNFFGDPLLAGRLVAVVFGLLTAIGLFCISEKLFDRKVAVISFLLYTFNPLFSFYDRQALMESAIASVGVWSFYFYLKTEANKDYKPGVVLGVILGLGYFIKSNAFVFVISTAILFVYHLIRQKKKEKLLLTAIVVFSTALIIVLPLLLNSTFWESLSQNQKYILTPAELIRLPILQWLKNIKGTAEISLIYLNPVIILGAVYSSYLFFKQGKKEGKMLVLWVILGLIITNLLAVGITTRYIVSFSPLLIVLGSYAIIKYFKKNRVLAILAIIILTPTVLLTLVQIVNPIKYFDYLDKISSSHSEKKVYVQNWTSGYGVMEAINFVKNVSKDKKVVVGVRLDAGNPENAVLAYFYESKNVVPTYLDSQMFSGEMSKVDCLQTSVPLYFISRDGNLGSLDKYFLEVTRYNKPGGGNYVGVHRLDEDCQGDSVRLF